MHTIVPIARKQCSTTISEKDRVTVEPVSFHGEDALVTLGKRQSSDYLQHRIEVLEAKLAQLEVPAPKSRARRFPLLVSYGLVPLLAFVGWAMAQQEMVPDPDANDLIKDVGGITQVTAPFEVVDASGKVILSVRNEDNSDAGVSIYVGEGAGALSVHSGSAATVAELGTDENGNGILRALDAQGNLRAGISGEAVIGVFDESGEKALATLGANEHGAGTLSLLGRGGKLGVEAVAGTESDGGVIRAMNANGQIVAGVGVDLRGKGLVAVVDTGGTAQLSISDAGAPALVILDKSNKQLAAVESVNGKGRVAILEQGRAAAELTAAVAGGGRLVVHNSGGEPVAAVGPSPSGKGGISVYDNGQPVATLEAGDSGGGELDLSNAAGTGGIEAYGSDPDSGGGSVIAFNKSGEEVAGLGTTPDGKGWVAVAENDQQVAALKADGHGAGSMVLMSAEGQKGIEAIGQDEDGSGGSVKVFSGADEPAVFVGVVDEGGGLVAVFAKDDASAGLSSDKLALFDGKEPVVSIESDPGQLIVFDAEGEAVKVGLDDQGAGEVIISKQGKQAVSLEVTSGGEGEVDVYGENGDRPVAALRSKGGTGLVAVTNSNGDVVSEMSVAAGLGQVVVWNPGGQKPAAIMTRSPQYDGGVVQVGNPTTSVASLMVGGSGEGFLQLTDASGTPMVAAGTTNDGRGRVDAGPGNKCAPGGMGLTIPDCIIGPKK